MYSAIKIRGERAYSLARKAKLKDKAKSFHREKKLTNSDCSISLLTELGFLLTVERNIYSRVSKRFSS